MDLRDKENDVIWYCVILAQLTAGILKPLGTGYRFLAVKNYLVFYVGIGDTVQIRRILYAKQDYIHLL